MTYTLPVIRITTDDPLTRAEHEGWSPVTLEGSDPDDAKADLFRIRHTDRGLTAYLVEPRAGSEHFGDRRIYGTDTEGNRLDAADLPITAVLALEAAVEEHAAARTRGGWHRLRQVPTEYRLVVHHPADNITAELIPPPSGKLRLLVINGNVAGSDVSTTGHLRIWRGAPGAMLATRELLGPEAVPPAIVGELLAAATTIGSSR